MNSDCTEQKKVFRPSWSLKKRHPGYQKLFRPSWSLKKRPPVIEKCLDHPGLRSNAAPGSKEKGVVILVLRETGASLDIGCEKYAAPEMFTGDHASIKHILDNGMTCLRPAELEIECGLGHVVSKPVVSPVHLDKEKYNDQFGLGEYLVEID
ncbi:hypothetical protein TNCV_3894081 [Trichonephila clavipes]|nr:hypothetical protein TNCV_3894081 [Trichonephila clavipes]